MKEGVNLIKNIFRIFPTLLIFLSISTIQSSKADIISVNFTKSEANAQQVSGTQGVELAENWTNSSKENELNLKASNGNESTAALYAPASRRDSFSGTPLNNSPMKSGLQFWGTNAPPFTISEIPYVNYKLIVYLTGFNNNNASFVSDGTTTYYWDPKAYSKVLSQTTQTDYEEGTTAEKHNYAIFGSEESPLTSESITISYGLAPGQSSGGGIGGFQLVNLSNEIIKSRTIEVTSFSFEPSTQTTAIRFTEIDEADFIIESSLNLDFEDGNIWYPSEGKVDTTSYPGEIEFTFQDTTIVDKRHFWRIVYP